jgi:hypothetical protein
MAPPVEVVVPACEAAAGAMPCWRVGPDAACAGMGDGLAVIVDRGGGVAPSGTRSKWSCRVCAANELASNCQLR